MNVQRLIDRLVIGAKLLLPDRAIKRFPPDFTLRRPTVSLLGKQLRRRKLCHLALYRIDFARLHADVPESTWRLLQEGARRHLSAGANDHLDERDWIAMDQLAPTDFVVAVTSGSAPSDAASAANGPDNNADSADAAVNLPAALLDKLERVRQTMEAGLSELAPEWRGRLRVTLTCSRVVPDARPSVALDEAYQLALARATRELTPRMESLQAELERLIAREDVTVLAQPIMNLTSGDVYGWEILARGPANSLFHYPAELFRFATQSRQLSRLEFAIVSRAFEEIASRGIREPVFLNVTAVTLGHPMFLPHVLRCLERHPQIGSRQVYFEITERHEITDLKAMADVMNGFRAHGFRFAVDDAGTGYSSLEWIGELGPELIKIDGAFVRQVDRVAAKETLLRALVGVAKEMNCDVVAEGVEREEEADVLFRLQVGMGQGYYFARPATLLHEHERDVFQETKARIQYRRGQFAS